LGASWLKREGKEAGNWYSPESSLYRSSVYERQVIVYRGRNRAVLALVSREKLSDGGFSIEQKLGEAERRLVLVSMEELSGGRGWYRERG